KRGRLSLRGTSEDACPTRNCRAAIKRNGEAHLDGSCRPVWTPSMNTPGSEPRHLSVLPAEVLDLLAVAPGQTIVDATVGAGGHARLLAERVSSTGRVIGLDRDATMLELARPRLAGLPVTLMHANFDGLPEVLEELGVPTVDAVLADLGFS